MRSLRGRSLLAVSLAAVAAAAAAVLLRGDCSSAPPWSAQSLLDPELVESRSVRVVDEDGRALCGVRVESDVSPSHNFTDEEGIAAVAVLRSRPQARVHCGFGGVEPELHTPLTDVVVRGLPRLEVRLVDSATGVPISGGRVVFRDVSLVQGADGVWREGPVVPVSAWGECGIQVDVEPPEGWATVTGTSFWGDVASRAAILRFDMPLYRTGSAWLRVVDGKGEPVKDALVERVSFEPPPWGYGGGERRLARIDTEVRFRAGPSGPDGLIEVRGVPDVPLNPVAVWVASCDARFSAREVGVGETSRASPLLMTPGWPNPPYNFGGGKGGGSRAGFPRDVQSRDALPLRVIHFDGRAAVGVAVTVARGQWSDRWSDGGGRAWLPSDAAGRRLVVATGSGFTATAAHVDLGGASEAVVREAATRSVRLRVVDEAGAPVPSADVVAECLAIRTTDGVEVPAARTIAAQMDGDVDIARPLTDGSGVAVLAVPHGRLRYTARLVAAEGSVESAADDVRVVVRRPRRGSQGQ